MTRRIIAWTSVAAIAIWAFPYVYAVGDLIAW